MDLNCHSWCSPWCSPLDAITIRIAYLHIGKSQDDDARSILYGPIGSSMRGALPATIPHRHAIWWAQYIWPGAIQTTLRFLGFQIHQLWQVRRADSNGGQVTPPTGGSIECIEYGSFLFLVCRMRQGEPHALTIKEIQILESEEANWRGDRLFFNSSRSYYRVLASYNSIEKMTNWWKHWFLREYLSMIIDGIACLGMPKLKSFVPASRIPFILRSRASLCTVSLPWNNRSRTICHGTPRVPSHGNIVAWRRSRRIARPYPKVGWERHHAIDIGEDSAHGPSAVIIGRDLPQAEKVMQWIWSIPLYSNGATCYLNSMILAQFWSMSIIMDFLCDIWDAWIDSFVRIFSFAGPEAVDICKDGFIGIQFRSWFVSHRPLS